jgi:hypothetical protein
MKLRPMKDAPTDRPILVWHDHDSDPYYESRPDDGIYVDIETEDLRSPPERTILTIYGAHCEGLGYTKDKGYFVAVWGGGVYEDESGEGWGPWTVIPDWWFEAHSEFETPLAPRGWVDLTEPEFPNGDQT